MEARADSAIAAALGHPGLDISFQKNGWNLLTGNVDVQAPTESRFIE